MGGVKGEQVAIKFLLSDPLALFFQEALSHYLSCAQGPEHIPGKIASTVRSDHLLPPAQQVAPAPTGVIGPITWTGVLEAMQICILTPPIHILWNQ